MTASICDESASVMTIHKRTLTGSKYAAYTDTVLRTVGVLYTYNHNDANRDLLWMLKTYTKRSGEWGRHPCDLLCQGQGSRGQLFCKDQLPYSTSYTNDGCTPLTIPM